MSMPICLAVTAIGHCIRDLLGNSLPDRRALARLFASHIKKDFSTEPHIKFIELSFKVRDKR